MSGVLAYLCFIGALVLAATTTASMAWRAVLAGAAVVISAALAASHLGLLGA